MALCERHIARGRPAQTGLLAWWPLICTRPSMTLARSPEGLMGGRPSSSSIRTLDVTRMMAAGTHTDSGGYTNICFSEQSHSSALQVALLAHGSLDAGLHPEKVSAVLQALWIAAQHSQPQVGSSWLGIMETFACHGLVSSRRSPVTGCSWPIIRKACSIHALGQVCMYTCQCCGAVHAASRLP